MLTEQGYTRRFFLFYLDFWISSHTDSGICIFWKFWAADGHGAVIKIDVDHIRADRIDAELLSVQFFFDSEQDCGIFSSSVGAPSAKASLKAKSSSLGFLTSSGKRLEGHWV